jgi:hypothetical protein
MVLQIALSKLKTKGKASFTTPTQHEHNTLSHEGGPTLRPTLM